MNTSEYSLKENIIGISCILLFMLPCSISCTDKKSQRINSPSSENIVVGGPFENGNFIYYGLPQNIDAIDTSAAWYLNGQKLLLTGTIYKKDGHTPASNVILYYYHTDLNGYYTYKPGMDERARKHGYIRGWVKTGADGKYFIYTIIPAPYPNDDLPIHIHPAIKEPRNISEYYIDDWVFDDDPLLTTAKRAVLVNRGGSGILKLTQSGQLKIGVRDIILGLKIPDYPD